MTTGTSSATGASAAVGSAHPLTAAAASYVGVIVLLYGLLYLAGSTGVQWWGLQPPGATLGPPSLIQRFQLRIAEGIYLGVFSSILAGGGFLMVRAERRAEAEGRIRPWARWRPLLALVAVALTATAAVAGALPSPERRVPFESSDFQLRPLSGGGPYDWFFVSRAFEAFKGEALYPELSVTWTENATGALISRDTLVTALVSSPSERPDLNQPFATGNLAPADGPYVLWTKYWLCETPATPPCSNYTASVSGLIAIVNQGAHVPFQLALGSAGSACIAAAFLLPGINIRRMISP